MSEQWAKTLVFFYVLFSHIRRRICCCTHFTFCSKYTYMYMSSQCRFFIGVDQFVNGCQVFCRGNAAQVPDVDHPARFSMGTAVPLPTLSACLAFYLTAFTFLVDLSVIKDIVPWEISCYEHVISHFTSCMVDSIDAGVSRLKYVTHVDTSIFCTSNISSKLLMGWFFATLCHIKYVGSYIFSKKKWLHLYIFQHFLLSTY